MLLLLLLELLVGSFLRSMGEYGYALAHRNVIDTGNIVRKAISGETKDEPKGSKGVARGDRGLE